MRNSEAAAQLFPYAGRHGERHLLSSNVACDMPDRSSRAAAAVVVAVVRVYSGVAPFSVICCRTTWQCHACPISIGIRRACFRPAIHIIAPRHFTRTKRGDPGLVMCAVCSCFLYSMDGLSSATASSAKGNYVNTIMTPC